jgi:hypothetical protein
MEKMQTLPQIREALIKIAGQLSEIENDLGRETAGSPKEKPFFGDKYSNIIPFPRRSLGPVKPGRPTRFDYLVPILARPGEPLPHSIPDFRALLQRDGLILLSWAKKHTAMGERYTAYWVTSQGTSRYYASADLEADQFIFAVPVCKSYAAEDGIEFYGQNNPAYIVHVAPELMMSGRQAEDERPEHIKKLKAAGMEADYNYHFLLTKNKKMRALRRREETLFRESRA